MYIYIYVPDIGLAVRVFANGPGDLGSIPGRVIPKTQKGSLRVTLDYGRQLYFTYIYIYIFIYKFYIYKNSQQQKIKQNPCRRPVKWSKALGLV